MTTETEVLPLDDRICFSIYGAHIAINRLYKPLLDALDITYPQYLVLATLWETDNLTIGTIAERLGLESSTITPLVKRLEKAGFLQRQRNPSDERQVMVCLTQKGNALARETKCLDETLIASSGMTTNDLSALNRGIQALRDAVTKAPET